MLRTQTIWQVLEVYKTIGRLIVHAIREELSRRQLKRVQSRFEPDGVALLEHKERGKLYIMLVRKWKRCKH
jgi:hypothetical protein